MSMYECGGLEHTLSRRSMLGLLGSAPFLLRPLARRKGRQVLLIWLDGGMSQLETFDPKPRTPFGGPFRAIPTSVPGTHISELMPRTAKQMHRVSIVRSMSTKDNSHSIGVGRVLRGDPVNRGVDYPYLGSALTRFLPQESDLPPYVWIKPGGGGFIAQHAGILGAKYGALALGDGKPPLLVHRPAGLSEAADRERQSLREAANARFKGRRIGSDVDAYDSSFALAEKLMARKAVFEENPEKKDVERYGAHPLGRHLLQARKLLEAGVQFVKVTSFHWDTHCDHFRMHQAMVPQIDRPFAALIEDLHDRGMNENVTVLLMSEFGRTPKINGRWGRDHWPEAWSLALAGAGIKPGVVVGKTSPDGAWVDESPYDAGHLFHTIFRAVGLDPDKLEYENNGQPLPVLREDMGPMKEVLA
jgi:hypothetical protein